MVGKFVFVFFCFGFVFEAGTCDNRNLDTLKNVIQLELLVGNHIAHLQQKIDNLNLGENCTRDVQEFVKGMLNLNYWAVKMFDSAEKFPSGFLLGRAMAFGHIDECLDVVHANFTGKHCVVEVLLRPASSDNPKFAQLPFLPSRVLNRQFGVGLCVPSTCNSTDINNAIDGLGLNQVIKSQVYEEGCLSKLSVKLRTKDYIVLVFFCLLIVIALASTAYDMLTEVPEKSASYPPHEVLRSFSLRSNLRRLFNVEVNDKSQEMNALHGMRFISFTWVVLGHIYYMYFTMGNGVNTLNQLEILNDGFYTPITNAYLAVDSFFFISGLLACFVFFKSVSTKGHYDAPVALINRYLRLTPSLMVLILINYTILSRISVAPYSEAYFEKTENNCRKNWWMYALYIQNLFKHDRFLCFHVSWYLSADMQMFLVSPLVLYVLHFWPKWAPPYLFLLIVGSSFFSFVNSYTQNLPPNHIFRTVFNKENDYNEYHWFHTRMSSWLVGVATAYFICLIKVKKINFSPNRVWIVVGWLTAGFLCLSSLYGMAAFMPYETTMVKHSAFERSTYRTFSRLGWSLGLSWIVIACTNNCGGVINRFLSCNALRPLSRLSYCGFLLHESFQIFRSLDEVKISGHFRSLRNLYTYFGDMACVILLAIPMALLIEMPFANLQRIFLKNLKILPYPKKESLCHQMEEK